MSGTIGFILSLVILIYLSYKGYSPFITSILAALCVGLFSGFDVFVTLNDYYMPSAVGFIKNWLLIFTLGAVFSELLTVTKSVDSIAYTLLKIFKSKNVIAVVALITAILTLGGVNFYVQIFIIWPLCEVFAKEADIPRGLFIGVYYMGMFCVAAFPGSPGMCNVILSQSLGVSGASGAILGIFLTAISLGLGLTYFAYRKNKYSAEKKNFENQSESAQQDNLISESAYPNAFFAAAPMVLVIAMYITLTSKSVSLILGLSSSEAVMVCMFAGSLLCIALNIKRLKGGLKQAVISSSMAGIFPCLNAALLTGYLGVFTASAAYTTLTAFIQNLDTNVFFQAVLAANIMSFITGSGTVAASPVVSALKESFVRANVSMDLMRPVMAAGLSGSSISPHCGGLSGVMKYANVNLAECYRDIFFGVVLVNVITSVIGAAVASLL